MSTWHTMTAKKKAEEAKRLLEERALDRLRSDIDTCAGGDGPRPARTDAGRFDLLREVQAEHYVRQMSGDEKRDLANVRDGKLRVVGGDDGRRFRA